MKTCKLNKMIGVTAILLITIVAMFTLLFSNVEKSFADEEPATDQQEVATQNDNLDFWS